LERRAAVDGRLGTGDDVLIATGETLSQVQDRVLGVGVDNAPLFSYLPGYVTVDVSAGLRLSARHELFLDVLNVTDEYFRGMSWGMPGPGRSIRARYAVSS
jgi:outer membrane receptor protein involved in Fe transport